MQNSRSTNTKPFPWKCGHCRERAVQLAVVPYTTDAEYDGRTYTITVPELRVPRCQNCGELVLDTNANRQITIALRHHLRLLTPEQIRQNREFLGLTQRQLASHLGIAEATLSRWETGSQIQQRVLDRLLRLYFSSAAVRESLADEEKVGELGTSVGAGSEVDSSIAPGSEELDRKIIEIFKANLDKPSIRQTLSERLKPFNPLAQVGAAAFIPGPTIPVLCVAALASLVPSLIAWSLSTDRNTLDSWQTILRNRFAGALTASTNPWAEDRWFVAPLRSTGPEDIETSSQLAGLAKGLDTLPPTKRERFIQEVQHLMKLVA